MSLRVCNLTIGEGQAIRTVFPVRVFPGAAIPERGLTQGGFPGADVPERGLRQGGFPGEGGFPGGDFPGVGFPGGVFPGGGFSGGLSGGRGPGGVGTSFNAAQSGTVSFNTPVGGFSGSIGNAFSGGFGVPR